MYGNHECIKILKLCIFINNTCKIYNIDVLLCKQPLAGREETLYFLLNVVYDGEGAKSFLTPVIHRELQCEQ